MRSELEDWKKSYGRSLVEPATMDDYDEATRERLEDLGYLE
jgi:hypothetical protein